MLFPVNMNMALARRSVSEITGAVGFGFIGSVSGTEDMRAWDVSSSSSRVRRDYYALSRSGLSGSLPYSIQRTEGRMLPCRVLCSG